MFKALGRLQRYKNWRIAIRGIELKAIVADSFIKKAIGLMYREGIGGNECMFFIFGKEGFPGIWMRNMLFSIDVIWLDKNMRVSCFLANLKPCKGMGINCRVYTPKRRSRYLIETKSGFVAKNGIKTGDKISIISKTAKADAAQRAKQPSHNQ